MPRPGNVERVLPQRPVTPRPSDQRQPERRQVEYGPKDLRQEEHGAVVGIAAPGRNCERDGGATSCAPHGTPQNEATSGVEGTKLPLSIASSVLAIAGATEYCWPMSFREPGPSTPLEPTAHSALAARPTRLFDGARDMLGGAGFLLLHPAYRRWRRCESWCSSA